MRHEVMFCRVCSNVWLIHMSYLTYPYATWCRTCKADTGCIAEATRTADTQPGPHADLFEAVMLDWLANIPVPTLAMDTLRFALKLELVEE